MTDDYRASFEAARGQVASAERAEDECGAVAEAIHGLVRSARHINEGEWQHVLVQLAHAAEAAERQDASRAMHHLRSVERLLP